MGRKTKQTVEYFPHFVMDSKTKRILTRYWKNDGYAVWFKLLELLCSEDGHYLDVSGAVEWEDFIIYLDVPSQTAKEILNKLADMGKINPELWVQKQLIWCDALIENLRPVYGKRVVSLPEKPTLDGFPSRKNEDGGISGAEKGISEDIRGESTQSRVEYSRVKESKAEREPQAATAPPAKTRKIIPPDIANVVAYCIERGNGISPQAFMDFYEARGWMLTARTKMKDWQAAIRTWEQREKERAKHATSPPVPKMNLVLGKGGGV